jgi:hypothetical protein
VYRVKALPLTFFFFVLVDKMIFFFFFVGVHGKTSSINRGILKENVERA